MLNDKESPFTLTLTDSGLRLPVLRFRGEEALNQPYRFDLRLIGVAPAIAPGTLLHQPAFLHLSAHHGIHGLIASASCEHRGTHRVGYRLSLVPHLQRLAQGSKRRVFTQLSVPQILQRLMAENALPGDGYRVEMSVGQYPPRPFCVQYEESDLALIQRLCEEEGIHYHFEHGPAGHVVVFADDSLSLPQEPLPLAFKADEQTPSPCVSALYQQHHAAPVAALPRVRDRGQRAAYQDAANQVAADPPPLRPSPEQSHLEQRSRRHLQRKRCQLRSIEGRSDCCALRSAGLLMVTEHPISHFNEHWRITSVRHQGQSPSILDPTCVVQRYHNDFSAQPWSSDFRPPLQQPRPSVVGYHLARVLGASGQPAQLDAQGRIAVQLWPQAETHADDSDAVWLPIAMTRVNGRIAADELPGAGSEVWVSFLDGDPDRPIILLGHSRRLPPREPPSTGDSSLLLDWLLNGSEQ
ncbi:type VI secretion system tip protein TssI/VgrG [Pseudomonas sp. SWRI99]|uniref:type VI secretion system Vgr family protein n=1 Tax=Pseudomonas sp. SWRI99 TaxID=2745506 RepID=UPI001644DD05|nr:type VI secretion system tip protein TssI/VgrG [Pseudomonas sp. SWRI99]MBC3779588.1 type VI secretion system tip protein VgrG [Pseudomonas sp. SWRI99]